MAGDPLGHDIAAALLGSEGDSAIKVVLTIELDHAPTLEVTRRFFLNNPAEVIQTVQNYRLVPVLKENPA